MVRIFAYFWSGPETGHTVPDVSSQVERNNHFTCPTAYAPDNTAWYVLRLLSHKLTGLSRVQQGPYLQSCSPDSWPPACNDTQGKSSPGAGLRIRLWCISWSSFRHISVAGLCSPGDIQYINHSCQFGIIRSLAEGSLCPIVQATVEFAIC